MPSFDQIFERKEKKYLLTDERKTALLEAIGSRLTPDWHGPSTVCSLYFDTPDYRIIRASIDARAYKEKLRLRCYGTPTADDPVFLELKKKYKGVVYKRREKLSLAAAHEYIETGRMPADTQIMREIDWMRKSSGDLAPAILLAYDREAYYSEQLPGLRLTFDTNVRFRTEDLRLDHGAHGTPILKVGTYILEIKTLGAMPLWLTHALDALALYPTSFSKYGTAYREHLCPAHLHSIYIGENHAEHTVSTDLHQRV